MSKCAAQTKGWNTESEAEDSAGSGPVAKLRIGRHDCFDRIAFSVYGTTPRYLVGYVDVVRTGGKGDPVYTDGDAQLQVIVSDVRDLNVKPRPLPPGATLYSTSQLRGWKTLSEIRYAGWFESQSTYAVGIKDRERRFRAGTVSATIGGRAATVLYVDIAH